MHSFSIQDDRNTRFPSTTNYKNSNIIKRCYIENWPFIIVDNVINFRHCTAPAAAHCVCVNLHCI